MGTTVRSSNLGVDKQLFSSLNRLGSIQPPIQWVPPFIPGGKRPGREVDHHLPLPQRLRMSGAIILIPPTLFSWAGERQICLLSCRSAPHCDARNAKCSPTFGPFNRRV